MNKNTSYESTVRENLESYEDEELIKKIRSGDLTEVSEKIAKSIIEERSKEKNTDYLYTLENKIEKVILEEEKEKENSIKDKQEYAYQTLKIMNAIGVILWGLGLITSFMFFLYSLYSENINPLIPLLSFLYNGFTILSPFYTWKVCHSEKYRKLTSTSTMLNLLNLVLLFLLCLFGLIISDKLPTGILGLGLSIGIPSFINLIFLPKFEEAETNNI